MKIHFITILVTSSMLLSSCRNSEHIATGLIYQVNLERDINNISTIPLSYLGSKLEYIPLETDSACLIRRISGIFVSDSFLFVSDNNRLLLFNRDGNFIRQIGSSGRGPGEYLRVRDFDIDVHNEEVYILEGRKVLVYNFNGLFRRDFVLGFPSFEFVINGNNELVFLPINFAQKTDEQEYSLYIMNKNGKNITKIPKILKRINGGIAIPNSPLYMYTDILHFMEFGVDTLYSYENHVKKPHAIFHAGSLKLPPDPMLDEVMKLNGKVWVDNILETNKSLFVKTYSSLAPLTSAYCVFDKTTSIITILKDKGFINDFDGGLEFFPTYYFTENDSEYMVGLIDPFQLKTQINSMEFKNSTPKYPEKKKELEKLANSLKETDNPVLMLVRLKK
jgi:hypothetical protein